MISTGFRIRHGLGASEPESASRQAGELGVFSGGKEKKLLEAQIFQNLREVLGNLCQADLGCSGRVFIIFIVYPLPRP